MLFPATGHRLDAYNVEGHAIADIKVDTPTPAPIPQSQHPSAPQAHAHAPYQQFNHNQPAPAAPTPSQAPQPFVDPAILSVGKRASVAPPSNQPIAAAPQEAPATPIKPITSTAAAPLPPNASPFVGVAKERTIRKPSAATLEGPFSSLDIADAGELDSDDGKAQEQPSVRRTSITKTRTGKPMEDAPVAKGEDSFKRTRRGGKARKKEVAAQERRNGGDPNASPEAKRKGYVTHSILSMMQSIIHANLN